MKKLLYFSCLFFLLFACTPSVTFNQPQPEDVDSLTLFPKKLIGNYVNENGSSRLKIDHNCMTIFYDYDVKFSKESIGWDTIALAEQKKFVQDGDSVLENVNYCDTLFYISEGNILKKYKGYYILNTIKDENSWEVKNMKLQKGVLTIGSISLKDELLNLEKIKESPIDTTTYNLQFTKKQFGNYLKGESFKNKEIYFRIK